MYYMVHGLYDQGLFRGKVMHYQAWMDSHPLRDLPDRSALYPLFHKYFEKIPEYFGLAKLRVLALSHRAIDSLINCIFS